VLSTAQIINVERLAPNHRATFSGTWSKGSWTINARENFYGSWENATDYPTATDSNGNVIAAQVFGSKFTTDLDISYAYNDHMTLTAGASNLFNTYPDKIKASSSNPLYPVTGGTADGQIYPRTGGPFGMNGGFWYVRAKITY
jgi:iron complex outermembrane receptor protein